MTAQQQIIREFKFLYENPTLREIEAMTGINKNRFFRISHGLEMRLDEYLKIQEMVKIKKQNSARLQNITNRFLDVLSESELGQLVQSLETKLFKWNLLNDQSLNREVFSA